MNDAVEIINLKNRAQVPPPSKCIMPGMSPATDGVDELLGSGTEEAVYKKGFDEGFQEGAEEGGKEGSKAGLKTGADVGFELGKYKGFAVAARQTLIGTSSTTTTTTNTSSPVQDNRARSIKLCDKVIKLVDDFKLENVTSIYDACSQVRIQYNLLRSTLGITDDSGEDNQTIVGQKYSF
ncbi:unnamed protein product [Orchesella dallaii]|uniref:Essential protein Yae1 N-terminal domain-containing protein n=1 Tax=Orchesella dallaii TaxID=48710 RepID=A0ABP1QQP9_9HEXA